MLVELSIGTQSQKVISALKKSIDNIDFYSHTKMPAFIKEAEARKLQFDRIVMTPAMLSKNAGKDLKKLNDYIKENSPGTEIVLFTTKENRIEVFEEFNKIFNSPLYTTINLGSVTVVNISKLIKDSIDEIEHMEGGKKYGINEEESESPVSTVNTANSVGVAFAVETSENNPVNIYKEPVNMGASVNSNLFEEQGKGFDFGHISEESGLGGDESLGIGNLSGMDEDDLSLGEFGNSHSDTGYLDDSEGEEDEELQAFLRQKEQSEPENKLEEPVNDTPVNPPVNTPAKVPVRKVSKPTSKQKEEISVPNINPEPEEVEEPVNASGPNIDLVIACKGTGSTQEIVDQAAKIVKQDGAKVLLVDLDSVENGLLSFIDINRFYMESAYQGITKQRVYFEDGIGIASNGYGFKVKSKELKNFLSGKSLEGYDMVYIDCPAECLYSLDVDILKMCSNILVMSGTDLSQMIATSLALTCRDSVSVGVERYIMGNCYVEFVGALDPQVVDYLKEICLFANGSWLDRIGL